MLIDPEGEKSVQGRCAVWATAPCQEPRPFLCVSAPFDPAVRPVTRSDRLSIRCKEAKMVFFHQFAPTSVPHTLSPPDTNGTRIRINVLRINDLSSTLTSIRFIELYINNIEQASETQGLPSSEIEIMLLIIG